MYGIRSLHTYSSYVCLWGTYWVFTSPHFLSKIEMSHDSVSFSHSQVSFPSLRMSFEMMMGLCILMLEKSWEYGICTIYRQPIMDSGQPPYSGQTACPLPKSACTPHISTSEMQTPLTSEQWTNLTSQTVIMCTKLPRTTIHAEQAEGFGMCNPRAFYAYFEISLTHM